MCTRCAFSEKDAPSSSVMCQICFRNPVNASRSFEPKKIGSTEVKEPIDAYISKELYEMLEKYFREKALCFTRGQVTVSSVPTPSLTASPVSIQYTSTCTGYWWKQGGSTDETS